MVQLRDILKANTATESVPHPEATTLPADQDVRRVNRVTVYIDQPGPDGNVHRCQEAPY